MQLIIKQKKQYFSPTIYCTLCFVLLLCGCSKEEILYDMLPNEKFTISVTDGGYTASNAKSSSATRATENGYTTEFTAGDKIGLYAVVDGAIVATNICLTAEDNGTGGVNWTGNAYYGGTTAKYFAYYPYQSSLTGTLIPSATNAAGFFVNVVSAWNPATDQSTYAKYTAQDLMVGSGTLGKLADAYTLSFTLTHAMALAVIETPMTKYTFSNSNPAIPDYYISAPETKFYGFTPYSPSVGTYRLLIKPTQNGAPDLVGSYIAAGGLIKEYAIVQNSIAAANYVHSKVDGGIIAKNHTLQVGDFYLKDGSLLGKDEIPTTEQIAACIGIVYWVGDITGDDPLLKREHPGCTHGLVVALHDEGSSLWSYDYEDITNNWLSKQQGGTYGITSLKVPDKMQGYANTQALIGYNAEHSSDNYKVLPITAIEQYNTDYPAPASSSGWYFPSVMELKYMCWGQGNSQSTDGKDILNAQLGIVQGTHLQPHYYWSGTESDGDWVWIVTFGNGYMLNNGDKDMNSFGVRAVVAF